MTTTTRRPVRTWHVLDDTGIGSVAMRGLAKQQTRIVADRVGAIPRSDYRLRLRIFVDGYADQSYASAEVWTSAGWQIVVRWAGYDVELPNHVRPNPPEWDAMMLRLLVLAEQILVGIVSESQPEFARQGFVSEEERRAEDWSE
jgi:hypothetical protein